MVSKIARVLLVSAVAFTGVALAEGTTATEQAPTEVPAPATPAPAPEATPETAPAH
jgi:hypothetical protein